MSKHEPTVFIVDDDETIRDGISQLLETVNLKTKVFASALEFLDFYDPAYPGCLVLDVRMPGISGVQLQNKLVEQNIDLPIIFITAHGSLRMGVDAVKKGAVDFIEKPFDDQVLLDRVQDAVAKDKELRHQDAERQEVNEKIALLTPRERQILGLIKAGKHSKAIAHELDLNQKTVEWHRAHIMEKMQTKSVVELIVLVNKTDIV